MKRIERLLLRDAYKAPLTEAAIGDRMAEAMILVSRGQLTTGPTGFIITAAGCEAIGKKPKPVDLGAVAKAGINELVEPAIQVVQAHMPEPTGDEAQDNSTAVTLLLTLCVAVGILARMTNVQAARCMEAIQVGRAVRIHDSPGGEG